MSPTATSTSRPTDLVGVRDAILDTPGAVAIAGAGTAADWAGTLRPVDTVLDLAGLHGVIAHNPGDMTVSVRAGTPLRDLTEELGPHGQHVSLDAARVAEGATVGGLVATADTGPAALVYGSMRDLVIGTTVVLADGTVARSGGHVIKNVAGYDLAKLMQGSFGTLAVLAEVVLRLHPVPKASATLAVRCSLGAAAEHAARVLRSPLEPVALEWVRSERDTASGDGAGTAGAGPEGGELLIRLEGTEAALPERVERLGKLIDGTEGGGAAAWRRHAQLAGGGAGRAVLRIGTRPGALPALLGRLPALAVAAGLGTGVATVTLPAERDAVARAHAAVHGVGGTSMLRSRPAGLDLPAWGPPPSAVNVHRAVKRALDPDGRFGPGRFDPWEI